MNKYENGKIYKLVGENDLWYIGSTTETLNRRLSRHNRTITCMSKYLINPQIELMEDYPCNNAMELRMREQHYLAKYRDKCINKNNAYTTEEEKKIQHRKATEEWCKNNKEHRSKYFKNFRENNKEKLSEYNKQYRKENKQKIKEKIKCECGSILTKAKLNRHKQSKKHLNYLQNKNES